MIAGTKVHLILKKDIVGTHACLCFGFTKKEYIFLKVINNWIGFLNLQFVLFLLERLENSESTLQKKKKTSLQISSECQFTQSLEGRNEAGTSSCCRHNYHTNSRRHKYLQQLKSMCKCLGTSLLGIRQPWQHRGGSSNNDD